MNLGDLFQTLGSTDTECPKCHKKGTVERENLVYTSYPPQYRFGCNSCGHLWFSTNYFGIPDFDLPDFDDDLPDQAILYPQPEKNTEMGWECPRCGRCYSPKTTECPYCRPHNFYVDMGTHMSGGTNSTLTKDTTGTFEIR